MGVLLAVSSVRREMKSWMQESMARIGGGWGECMRRRSCVWRLGALWFVRSQTDTGLGACQLLCVGDAVEHSRQTGTSLWGLTVWVSGGEEIHLWLLLPGDTLDGIEAGLSVILFDAVYNGNEVGI